MYFGDKLQRISIGGRELPVKIDMFVLEKIQEEYETLHNFELKVKGLEERLDENGIAEVDEEGNVLYNRVPVNIKALIDVLPLMVREGCEIEGIELELTDKEIVQKIEVGYPKIQEIVINAFNDCFRTSKKE